MNLIRRFKQKIKIILPTKLKDLVYYYLVKNIRSTKITGKYNEPWITRDSIRILETLLKDDYYGFEFGSGTSTIWLANKIKKLVSVENSNQWYKKMLKKLDRKGLNNIELKLIPLKNNQYADYIKNYPKDYFNIVFIDGRDRVDCIKNSIERVKSKGILLLDNSERNEYQEGKRVLSNWKEIETSNGKWKTTIWIKP